jgi:calcium-dependent protein kinase
VGTPNYVAPEILNGKYTEKCDIWSVGVIAFEFLSGKVPFEAKSMPKLFDRIRLGSIIMMGPRWDKVSPEAKEFVIALLNRDDQSRPSA